VDVIVSLAKQTDADLVLVGAAGRKGRTTDMANNAESLLDQPCVLRAGRRPTLPTAIVYREGAASDGIFG